MPAGLGRAEHSQGCDEWIPFYSSGGPLLLRLEGKYSAEYFFFFLCIWALGDPTHGVIFLSIYPSEVFVLVSKQEKNVSI